MSVTTVTHLNFQGQARQALTFYHAIFGGQLTAVAYKDFGHLDPVDADRVIWGQVVSDKGFRVMAFDVPAAKPWNPGENAFYLSLRGETAEEIAAHWEKLVEGGQVVEALAPAKWTALYGMLKDKFGVTWVLDVAPQASKPA